MRQDTPICKNFQKFMRNDLNKTELFKMISQAVVMLPQSSVTVFATIGDGVVTNAAIDTSNLEICNHEEADTRVLLHVLDGSKSGIKKISIVTVDTDVVIIAIRHFLALNLEELWIEFGVGKSKRFIPIHQYAEQLGPTLCKSLTLWFAVTGCDTVSMFNGKGKKTAWKVLRLFEDGIDTFAK